MKPLTGYNEWPWFAVYDIESVAWTTLKCLCHVDEWGNYLTFTDVGKYVDWLFSIRGFQGEHVWAHWGGRFDHRFVLHECYKRGYTFEIVLSGNLMIILEVTNGEKRKIRFCESARIMPDSVEKIGESIGLKKLDADRTNIEGLSWDEVVTYCFRDCAIVLRGLISMRSVLVASGFDFAYTLASMATRYVRRSEVLDWRRFYEEDTKEKVSHLKGRRQKLMQSREFYAADQFATGAIHGGRTEAFVTSEISRPVLIGPFFYYDITSCYPSAMLEELPAYFERFDGPIKLRNGQVDVKRTLTRCGVTQAWVNIPPGSMKYPLLPVRFEPSHIAAIMAGQEKVDFMGQSISKSELTKRLSNKVLFLEGSFERVWTNIELYELWAHMKDVPGFQLEILTCAIYEPLAFMRPFIEMFWQLREGAIQASDEFKKYTYKITMNASYGKLAEQYDKVKVVHGAAVKRAKDDYGAGAMSASSVPGIYLVHHTAEGAFRHAAAGAYVTARGRIRLWHAMLDAQAAGARVLYCDTDSIITDKPIYGAAKHKKLGEWHLEHEIRRMEIWGPKLYMYETSKGEIVYRAKGMPIERRENKHKPEVTQELWEDFTAELKGLKRPTASKEGIYGFMTDLNNGRIAPTAFALKRRATNRDTKRQHASGESVPLYIVERSGRVTRNPKPPTKKERKFRAVG